MRSFVFTVFVIMKEGLHINPVWKMWCFFVQKVCKQVLALELHEYEVGTNHLDKEGKTYSNGNIIRNCLLFWCSECSKMKIITEIYVFLHSIYDGNI